MSLARFVGKEAAQVFSTGFQTNQGVIAPLVGRSDTIVMDRLVHASIVDGTRLGFGRVRRFRHNDIESLRRNLEAMTDSAGLLVIVDGVYSMEGDIAPLPENMGRGQRIRSADVMVDDAHGIGVLGKHGKGTTEHFGLGEEVDLVMGTFSEYSGIIGGFCRWGRKSNFLYQTPFPSAHLFRLHAAFGHSRSPAALDVIETEPEILDRLWSNTRFLTKGILELGYDIGPTQTPVVPMIIGDDIKTAIFWKRLFDEGLYTNCVVAPAVRPGQQPGYACAQWLQQCRGFGKDVGNLRAGGQGVGINPMMEV